MGNSDSKLNYRKAVVQLTTKNQSIDPADEAFWSQFWSDKISNIQDIFTLIPAFEIRALREEAPSNLATLCFKTIEKLKECSESSYITEKNQTAVLNCLRLLTRILPYLFEEPEWRGFFWSDSPFVKNDVPLAHTLLNALINLLFIPDFTVSAQKKGNNSDNESSNTIDSCEYIWEAGVGFSHSPPQNFQHDFNRTEILKLLLTCFSETIYLPPIIEYHVQQNQWISYFTSFNNQHALPLFTSLLNIIFSYDPVGYGLPYNYLMFTDSRETLVEIACQLLCVALETNISITKDGNNEDQVVEERSFEGSNRGNLFISYISRIHRDEDFAFILKGFCRLLNNPMIQTFLPGSCKKINFHQEMLILFWKFCDFNKKFLYFVLKSSEVLDIMVPILYYLIDSRVDTSKTGLIHIGVFILLLLSGERNFGVRLNKPYVSKIPMDIPIFSGTHADLLIIVFHKLIANTNHRLQPLYDCLLTIIVNISPYIKSLCMVASTKLLHLLEIFSNVSFLLSNPNNYYLVFFLLEVLNNMIQYQFDGNYNLVYTIIRKRNLFFNLLNLQADQKAIDAAVNKQVQQQQQKKGAEKAKSADVSQVAAKSMDGAIPAREAEPGTLKATLAETPSIARMTEKTVSGPNREENLISSEIENFYGASPVQGTSSSFATNDKDLLNLQSDNESSQDAGVSNGANQLQSSFSSKDGPNTSKHSIDANELNSTTTSNSSNGSMSPTGKPQVLRAWTPTPEWVASWKSKLPLQTIMRLLQVLVPQVEKICIDKGLTDESEILKFLQNGTLVGLLPVPHPILIRKYQPNFGTIMWFRTYMWGVIYLRNMDPPIWYDTDVKLFEIQRV